MALPSTHAWVRQIRTSSKVAKMPLGSIKTEPATAIKTRFLRAPNIRGVSFSRCLHLAV